MGEFDQPTAPAKAFSSAAYWQRRYAKGGNSGSGSYGRLARYKAGYINDLALREGISSVIEFGSGDGNQASLFTFEEYTGVDVSPDVVAACKERFLDHPNWTFLLADGHPKPKHDIYHLSSGEASSRRPCAGATLPSRPAPSRPA